MRAKPILVLGNKADGPKPISEVTLRSALGFTKPLPPNTIIELFMSSAIKRTGYTEGLKWMCKYLKNKQ